MSNILFFRLKDIDAAFAGKFKEQKDSSDNWLPVPDHKVPVRLHIYIFVIFWETFVFKTLV